MKVKIGDKIHDSQKEPIMLILDPMDKLHILAMRPEANLHCSYPAGTSADVVKSFMNLPQPVKVEAEAEQ